MAAASSIPSPRQNSASRNRGMGSSRYAFIGTSPEISATANSGISEISRLIMEDIMRVRG